MRATAEVLEDHLRLRRCGDLDADLARNYAEDVVLLCEIGTFLGREAVRRSAQRLGLQLPGAEFTFPSKLVSGEYAFLVWKASSARCVVEHGVDSFVIRDGRIVLQTVFYRLSRGEIG